MASKATATVSASTASAVIGVIAGGILVYQPHLSGDANGDGFVNQADIDSVLANWLSVSTPGEVPPIDLSGARVYTEGGWTIEGPNWCLVRVRGESEDIAAALGIPTGGRKFLSVSPDFTLPEGATP